MVSIWGSLISREFGNLLATALSVNHQPSAARASLQHSTLHLALARDQFPAATYTGAKWASVSLPQSFILQTALSSSDSFQLALKVWKYRALVVIKLNLYFSANYFWWYPLHCGLLSDVTILGMSCLVKMNMECMVICLAGVTSRKATLGK